MEHIHHRSEHHTTNSSPSQKPLVIVFFLTISYFGFEIVGGLLSNSLALLADAGHMLSDVAALGIALFAAFVARRSPNAKCTYGYRRSEILAALANGIALFAIAITILIEAYQRFRNPPAINSGLMAVVAVGGLLVNVVSIWVLSGSNRENLNLRGAFLHVLTDALGSVGAIISAALIGMFGWVWADAAASMAIAFLVVISAWPLIKESIAIIMESAPKHVDVQSVRRAIADTPEVVGVHDLHVWAITNEIACLSAHIAVVSEDNRQDVLDKIKRLLRDRFRIRHVTIQIEQVDSDGHPISDCVICDG